MDKLSDRVMALEGPDREVDLAISVAINYKDVFEGFDAAWGAGGDEIFVTSHKEYVTKTGAVKRNTGYLDPAQFVPKWTASLDAAMSLVPEGWGKTLTEPSDGPISEAPCSALVFNLFMPEPNRFTSASASLPLALCAAALKARGL